LQAEPQTTRFGHQQSALQRGAGILPAERGASILLAERGASILLAGIGRKRNGHWQAGSLPHFDCTRIKPLASASSLHQPGSLCSEVGMILTHEAGKSTDATSKKAVVQKGDSHLLPERPEGCFAQKVAVTFLNHA
jgi:hypothetical protein